MGTTQASEKGKQWIKERYFKQLHGREWCFAAITKNKKSGKETTLSLKRLADTPILKYVRIRTNTNPYDPADAPYYARRKSKNTEEQLREIDDLLRMIWVLQKWGALYFGIFFRGEGKGKQ